MNTEILLANRVKTLEETVKVLQAQLNAQGQLIKNIQFTLDMMDADIENIKDNFKA